MSREIGTIWTDIAQAARKWGEAQRSRLEWGSHLDEFEQLVKNKVTITCIYHLNKFIGPEVNVIE